MRLSDNKMTGIRKWALTAWLVGLLTLTGCVTTSDPVTSVSGSPAIRSKELTPDQQAEIVKKRFQERWDAMIAKDYAKAYSYLSPATRALVTEAQFVARFSKGQFKKIEQPEVKCEEDVCMVRFMLIYDHAIMKGVVTPTGEKWFFLEGEAWFNLPE
jgi:hypothetical protein